MIPPINCYDESCNGVYVKCKGLIAKLSPEELAAEEAAAWRGDEQSGSPTDSAHDDYGDIRGSIPSYECATCGDRHTARAAVGHESAWARGAERCERVYCNVCKRRPALDELREHIGANA